MKEVLGKILSWSEASQQGEVEGDDGAVYSFTSKEWTEVGEPQVHGGVRVICHNGRDASNVEYLAIEHIPVIKTTVYSEEGEVQSVTHTRFIGGPWRVRSDALAWMAAGRELHAQSSHVDISDLSDLLKAEHPPISIRGSVVKYCYGIAIELYFKWILLEAKVPYRKDHRLLQLLKKLPSRVVDRLRGIYSGYIEENTPVFRMKEAHINGIEELIFDWSTFDRYIENLDRGKFVMGRYADPAEYSIFQSLSSQMSREMNWYMDSEDFFVLGDLILAYVPNPADYSQ